MLRRWFLMGIAIITSVAVNGESAEPPPTITPPPTIADAALERMLQYAQGHAEFKNLYFKIHEKEFLRLVKEGQAPQTLFIACSDSRVVPDLMLGTKPGDLFVIRNAGNFVPPDNPSLAWDGIAASIQYAVEVLGVKDIIVCGHSHCGAIRGLFQNIDETKLNLLKKWLKVGERAKQVTLLTVGKDQLSQDELYRLTEEISVIYQLDHLMTYAFIRQRVENKELTLHGWYFEIEKGQITYFDPQENRFLPLVQSSS